MYDMKDTLFDTLNANIINDLKEQNSRNRVIVSNTSPSLYFLYHVPRLGFDSYILKNSDYSIHTERSFSRREIKGLSEKNLNPILSDEELNNIVGYAMTLSEVQDLLRDEVVMREFGKHGRCDILLSMLSLFNSFDYDKIEKYRDSSKYPDLFQKILRVLLLCIPQFSIDEEYACLASDEPTYGLITARKKRQKYDHLLSDFKSGTLENKLPERLLLLVTFVEGFLWELCNHELMNFYIGNLYETLIKGLNKKNDLYNLLETNAFYLIPFDFYLYGEIEERKDSHAKIVRIFRSHLSEILLFAKTFISRLNFDSVQLYSDLSNPILPKSILHGITSICFPKKIGFFELDQDGKLVLIDNAFESIDENPSNHSLEKLINPWVLYKTTNSFVPQFDSILSDELLRYNKSNQVLIKTQNAFNQTKYIAIEFFPGKKFCIKNIIPNIGHFTYTFNAFVEKLLYIHRSARFNSDMTLWYKKAFCELYEHADKIRIANQYESACVNSGYRSWEENYFEDLLKDRNNALICNYGAYTGRLERKLLDNSNLNARIKLIYAIDQNERYLKTLNRELPSEKICTICNDFRNINLSTKKDTIDIVCILHTVFGYFSDDEENSSVLCKAFDLLKPGGVLLIDQFNVYSKPKHCDSNANVGVFEFEYNSEKYKLVKTSNLKQAGENDSYGLYYGNYMYFQISDGSEKLVKCDTYEIKLYTKAWFEQILEEHGASFDLDVQYKDEQLGMNNCDDTVGRSMTMVIKIVKKQKPVTKEDAERILNAFRDKIKNVLPDRKYIALNHDVMENRIRNNTDYSKIADELNKLILNFDQMDKADMNVLEKFLHANYETVQF